MKKIFLILGIVLTFTISLFIQSCSRNDRPEIIVATIEKDIPRIKKLISEGVDVNDRGGKNWQPAIHYTKDNYEILKLLIDAGADVNSEKSATGTVLTSGALNADKKVIKLLLKAGADINNQNNMCGCTPLMNASSNGRLEIVKILIEHKADATLKDKNGKTAYQLASDKKKYKNRQKVVEYFESIGITK